MIRPSHRSTLSNSILGPAAIVFALSFFRADFSFAESAQNFFKLKATSIEGQLTEFEKYRGQVVLLVNTASGCGYTPQYKNLQSLRLKYAAKGLVILGFPSNDFGGQEPGSNKEIKKFCELNYKVDFQLFTKLPVSGPQIQPVFKWLIDHSPQDISGPVQWNFEKFLIARDGKLAKRYRSGVSPESPELISALEAELKNAATK